MAEEPMLVWGTSRDDLPERWPRTPEGEPEKPALLTHLLESNYEVELLDEKLRVYGIPVLKNRGSLGSLSKIVLGFSGSGVDLYVPSSMLEDARALLEPVEDFEQEADNTVEN